MRRERTTVVCDRCRVEVDCPVSPFDSSQELRPAGWCNLWTAIASRSGWDLCPSCDAKFRLFLKGE